MALSKSPSFAGNLRVIFYNEVILPSIQTRKAGTEQLELRSSCRELKSCHSSHQMPFHRGINTPSHGAAHL